MNTPNIYLNYWADETEKISFQEILTWNLQTNTLNTIREELFNQLVSDKISELFPNIDWTQSRSFEKWEQFAETILLHISLPENVWKKWIENISGQNQETSTENYSYLENPFPEYVSPVLDENNLLTAEVYYMTEQLAQIDEIEAPKPEGLDYINPERISGNETERISENEGIETRKVFESIQANNSPLFKKVENQLVDKLANSISLYQSIHFTKSLFENDSLRFQQFIQFIDEQASPNHWEQEIASRFPEMYQSEDTKALSELLMLIEKKFS